MSPSDSDKIWGFYTKFYFIYKSLENKDLKMLFYLKIQILNLTAAFEKIGRFFSLENRQFREVDSIFKYTK